MKPPGKENLKAAASWLIVIAGVVGALYGVHSYIDWRIETRIHAPETLRRIASFVRPAVIFDTKSRILADQGGRRHLAEIRYVHGTKGASDTIIVVPHEFLAVAPLLESIDEEGYNFEVERGPGIEWHYTLRQDAYMESGVENPRFRLEILQ